MGIVIFVRCWFDLLQVPRPLLARRRRLVSCDCGGVPQRHGLASIGASAGFALLRRDAHAVERIHDRVWHVRAGRRGHALAGKGLRLQSELVVLIAIGSASPRCLFPC